MRPRPFDEGREFLNTGIDIGRAFCRRRATEYVEGPVETLEQRGQVVTQRRQFGEFRIKRRKAIVERLPFVGKFCTRAVSGPCGVCSRDPISWASWSRAALNSLTRLTTPSREAENGASLVFSAP